MMSAIMQVAYLRVVHGLGRYVGWVGSGMIGPQFLERLVGHIVFSFCKYKLSNG